EVWACDAGQPDCRVVSLPLRTSHGRGGRQSRPDDGNCWLHSAVQPTLSRSRRACDDAVKLGLVRSFDQPGGKSLLTSALVAKRRSSHRRTARADDLRFFGLLLLIENYRAKAKEFARLMIVAKSLRHSRQYRKLAEMYWALALGEESDRAQPSKSSQRAPTAKSQPQRSRRGRRRRGRRPAGRTGSRPRTRRRLAAWAAASTSFLM